MSEIRVDTISEKTSANGVAVDGVTLKDGGIAATDGSTITTADNTDTLTLTSTDADANSGPNLRLFRNSSSPADADTIGVVEFEGRNDNSQDVIYSQMRTVVNDVSDGTEDGQIDIKIMNGGSLNMVASFKGPETVINDASIDHDFRVESNGNTHMLFVDGGNNRVGVGTTPDLGVGLHIRSADSGASVDSNADELVVEGSSSSGISILSGTGNEGAIKWGDSGDNNIGFISYDHAGNDMYIGVNAAARVKIHDNGVAAFNNGVALGVGTANTASNVLDDYEEGVTGDITINSNSGSVALASGFRQLAYTKVGRVVHVTGLLKPTTSDASGGINFALPFALADTSDRSEICRGFGYVVNAANSNSAGGGLVLEVQTAGSTTCAIIKTTNTANGLTDMNTTYIASSGTELSVDFSYIAA